MKFMYCPDAVDRKATEKQMEMLGLKETVNELV